MKDFKYYAYDNENKRLENETIIDNLFKDTVPRFGVAETEVGEIIRAVCRIIYRFYNDGDMAFLNYGIETVDSPLAYLLEHLMYTKDLEKLLSTYGNYNYEENKYLEVLDELMSCVIITIEYMFDKHEENTKNTEDCLDSDTDVMYYKLKVEPYDEYATDDEDEEDY